ncbi:uncharacterized protein EI90DRAFT_3033041 [Cantharellus anzutake]|uniref:uncharacterized protein n=1 Tax=Cantharellus anzutake TaxID=1750568 RepID=UPI0019071630|nr:uncharacterized protein EI90DRAFT_3096575 [Cantharellus anzutake]XP_038922145.1 uncharacterized protein EI90DRAFT_3033041 [Cantharellus anzutake]KAF8311532.1 hypothetical protein EI90DRAFT_3096575 [Cantharellus anzutake]KAF8341213.1 hypothetical protein EI90DRAFT_3033041 [Cantharellus anzutake]
MRLHHDPREHKDVNLAHGSAPTVKTPFTTTEMTLSAASEKLKNVNSSTAPKIPFSFPTLLQLDRYLEENSAKTMASVNQMKELKMAGEDLREQLRTLETRNGKETLPPLRNTLRYIQEVASADTPERKEAHQVAARKLSTLIAKIERHINSTKSKIGVNSAEYEALAISFASEPARHPYKLRAVLMHDGLYGPKNMYAYLFTNGNWYKSVWDEVTMVTEDTVIGDKAGLYLNSGPYMLIYSRDDPVPAPFPDSEGPVAPYWSDHHLRTVKDDNAALRSRLYGRNQNVWWDVPRMPEEEFWASGDLEGIDSLSSWTPELTTESANAEEKPAIFNTKHLSSWDQAPDIAVSQRGDVSSAMVTRDNTPAPSPQVSDTEMDDMTNQINDHPN